MNQALYNLLNESEELASHLSALGRASGFSLQLVAADTRGNACIRSAMQSELCPASHAHSLSRPASSELQALICGRHENGLGPRSVSCPCELPCGLSHIAYPIVADGKLLATLVVGVLRRRPSRSGFARLLEELRAHGLNPDAARLRQAYCAAPVLSERRYREAMVLVEHFAVWLIYKYRTVALAEKVSASPQIEAVRAYVHSHLTERLSPKKIAANLCVSPSHLCRLFKKKTGQTPTEYVNTLRIEEAKSLLTAPEAPIKSVAFATGFQSVPDFNRVFKKLVGVNPTQYRRSLAQPALPSVASRRSPS
jgi:AraC-like DNA-binding protein